MIVLDFIRQHMPHGWKQTPSGWISGNCPMCHTRGHSPDKRGRGGIMFQDEKFQYNCFNCGFKTGWSEDRRIAGRLSSLLKAFGVDESDIQRVNLELLKEQDAKDISKVYIPEQETKKTKIKWEPMELPPRSYPIGAYPIDELDTKELDKLALACTYLMKRGIDFHKHWYWSPHMHFANRVILPFMYQGVTVGYTARWVPEHRPEAMPKYYLQSPKHFVYNLDAQKKHDTVIVTEGQFDALITGGVALAGNTPSATQCSIIEDLGKNVVLLPDFDQPGRDTVNIAVKRGWAVSFPEWEENIKDAGDAAMHYGRLFTVRSVLESVETSSTKIKILAKSRCR